MINGSAEKDKFKEVAKSRPQLLAKIQTHTHTHFVFPDNDSLNASNANFLADKNFTTQINFFASTDTEQL